MIKTAFITGASSGIGYATAKILDKNGYSIIACGRRKERLIELQKELINDSFILTFDVRNNNDVAKAISLLPLKFHRIDLLLNNAGNAHGLASIQDGDLEDWDAMIDINVKGLLYVTKNVLPLLSKGSRIINIGSIAGKETYPNGNVYCASKYAVDTLTKGMRMDLLEHKILVSSINPGHVETEFAKVRFKGDSTKANSTYEGFEPLIAVDVAETVLFMATRPSNVNIADVTIFCRSQASATVINKN